jgi:hypothetical protein
MASFEQVGNDGLADLQWRDALLFFPAPVDHPVDTGFPEL